MKMVGTQMHDPSQSYLARPKSPLSAIFEPKTIAVIGATEREGSVGRTVIQNLLEGSGQLASHDMTADISQGTGGAKPKFEVFPINPGKPYILGCPAYKSILEVPKHVDLVVIVTPAQTVPDLIRDCGSKGVTAAVVISAGFKEMGAPGIELEKRLLAEAAKTGLKIVGPNCLGVMNPLHNLNATFAKRMALPGNIAFISQSGAMCTAALDWSFRERLGFSAFVSIGSMADVDWADLIDYLGHDPNTDSILMYMETIGDARRFLSAAKEVALNKPIIVIKAGRGEAAAKAAASHTGSLAGSDDAFVAAMKRVGVLRVDTIGELFDAARVLGKQPRPKGPKLLIVTNAGGPGVLATDAVEAHGAKMADISQETIEKLNAFLPKAWSHGNPVDVLGDASAELYGKTLEVVFDEPSADGILVILSPQDMTEPTATAHKVAAAVDKHRGKKPVLCAWMGGNQVAEGASILTKNNIPCFDFPDAAAKTFASIWHQSKDIQLMYETPHLPSVRRQSAGLSGLDLSPTSPAPTLPVKQQALALLRKAQDEGREVLTEKESKELLAMYDIPTVQTIICTSADQAASHADKMGYPIVVKLHSETITHKSDVGGVRLNVKSAEEVRHHFNDIRESLKKHVGSDVGFQGVTVQPMVESAGAYECIVGSFCDSQFGPLVLFGTGGSLVEVYRDKSLAIPPLNGTLARRLMEETKIYKALQGVRGQPPCDIAAIERILVKFSEMVGELSELLTECDINPLLVSHKRIIALDARVAVQAKNAPPHGKLAIRPYPSEYMSTKQLKTGESVELRPLRAEDEDALKHFHKGLSAETIKQRYLADLTLEQRTAHARLIGICTADYDRAINLGAFTSDGKLVGVGRLAKFPNRPELAELKLIIVDAYQRTGLGTHFMYELMRVGRKEGISEIKTVVLDQNEGMLKLFNKHSFKLEPRSDAPHLLEVTKAVEPKA